MDANELLATVIRVKRSTSNRDILAVCEIAEKALIKPGTSAAPSQAKFDRKAYQRDLMRRRRAAGKA